MDLAGPALGEGRRGEEAHARVARRHARARSRRCASVEPSSMTRISTATPRLASAASSARAMLPASLRAGIRIETSVPGPGVGARRRGEQDGDSRAPSSAGSAASARARKASAEDHAVVPARGPRARDRSARPRNAAARRRQRIVDAADAGAAPSERCGSAPARGSARRRSGGRGSPSSASSRRCSRAARGKASRSRAAHRRGRRRAGLRAALEPEGVFDRQRQHAAVGRELGEPHEAGLEAERALAHVAEAALRGDPERAVRRATGSRRWRVRKAAAPRGVSRSTPKAPMRREDPVALQHRGIDRRVALAAREEAVGGQDDRRRASHQAGWLE